MRGIGRLRDYSFRDLAAVVLPLLILLVVGFLGAAQFIQPAPPTTLVFSSGGDGGAYQRFAAVYGDFLSHYGIRFQEQSSAGSLQNLERLRDRGLTADAGFFQGGTGSPGAEDGLYSLGAFFYEPLWIFYRDGLAGRGSLDRVSQLKGLSLAIGAPGSGTRHLALEMLAANGLDERNSRLLDLGGLDLVAAFRSGRIDAAFVVGPPQSAAVWSLLFADGVRLMSLSQAEAYARRLPHLTRVVLPRGSVDLVRDLPAADVYLVAATATVLVRDETHPALVDLLMQAAAEAHGGAGIFQRPGEFPQARAVDFPLSREAERYYKSGKPLLQRYLPFWAATLLDRLMVMLIPVVALLFPILRYAPMIYGWRVRSRIYRRYGELKFLESEVEADSGGSDNSDWLARLDAIEKDVNHIPTPLAFSDMLYTLKSHIALVRGAIQRRCGG